MPKIDFQYIFNEPFGMVRHLLRWIPLACYVGIAAGTASAILLALLTYATNLRESHTWLVLLPAPMGWLMYSHFGKKSKAAITSSSNRFTIPKTSSPFA